MRVRVKWVGEDRLAPKVMGFINETRVREGDEFEIDETVIDEYIKDREATRCKMVATGYEFYQNFSPNIMEAIDAEGKVIEGFEHRWKKKLPEAESAQKPKKSRNSQKFDL